MINLPRHDAIPKRWRIFPVLALLVLGLSFTPFHGARGQVLNTNESGVRHAIVAAVEAEQQAPGAQKRDDEPRTATVDIAIRIVDYALDSRFYGVVDGKFPEFDLNRGAQPQEIWADRRCHQNRGLPRIWVLAINGKIGQGDKAWAIAATPRHIGEQIPRDEIVTQRDPHVELNNPNQDLVTIARTTESRLRVRLNLTSAKCRLGTD